MDIIVHGLPGLDTIAIAGRMAELSGSKSDRYQVYPSSLTVDAVIAGELTIAFVDGTVCDMDPLARGEKRLAKKRGWARLILTSSAKYEIRCYLLFGKRNRKSEAQPTGPCLVLIRMPDTASFLAGVPSDRSIADLSLPGTHDTCAFYGFPVSQCQQPKTRLTQQLLDGVRFLDIRCRVVKGELIVFHGIRNQRTKFTTVLSDLDDFLTSHPTETVIMSVKDELRSDDFSRLTWLDMAKYPHRWFLENRVPTLGEVRGKVIIMGRFWISPDDDNWDEGVGWRIPGWGAPTDDLRFDCGGTSGRLQDWYTLPSFLQIPEKFEITSRILQPDRTVDADTALIISYASASGYPLSPPFAIAKGFGWPAWGFGIEGVNSRLEGCLARQLSEGRKVKGIVPMDFYRQDGLGREDGGVMELLVLMNTL